MKKTLSCLLVLVMAMSLLALPAYAAPKVLFKDDFSNANLGEKWVNPVLDNDDNTKDNECENVPTVKSGKLYLENVKAFGSFFYMSPKNVKAKDFTLTAKIQSNVFNTGWVGISFRKDVNDRFNGCNNNFVTFDFGKKGHSEPVIYARAYRGYPGSAPVELVNKTDINGNSKTPLFYKGDCKAWHDIRLEVKGTNFKAYMDGQLLGDWDYKKNVNEGFISLNCCIFDGTVDDVVITEYEAMPAPKPAEKPTNKPTSSPKPTAKPEPKPTDKPDSTASTEAPYDVTQNEATKPTQPEISDKTQVTDAQDILTRKYKDITVDNTFYAIRLEKKLTVKDFLDSFKVADGYTLKLVDAEGKAVLDEASAVTDAMKLQVLKGEEIALTYDLNMETDEVAGADVPKGGIPAWTIVLIVAVVIIAAAGIVVFVLMKKGRLFRKK